MKENESMLHCVATVLDADFHPRKVEVWRRWIVNKPNYWRKSWVPAWEYFISKENKDEIPNNSICTTL